MAHRLVDGGTRWETIVPPDAVYGADRELGSAGLTGDRGLAFIANGPYKEGFAVLDVTDGTWSTVPLPTEGVGGFLIPCFTLGRLHMRVLPRGEDQIFTPDMVGQPEQYPFEAWSLDGTRWAGPVSVDLGPVVPNDEGSQLCAGGAFVAKNPYAGGSGVALVPHGPELRRIGFVDESHWQVGTGFEGSALTEDGRVITVDHERALTTTSGPVVEPGIEAFATSETADLVDLLVGEKDTYVGAPAGDVEAKSRSVATARRG